MKRALERHDRQEARVVPILLRPVHFTGAPFAKLQMLPANAKPIVSWRNRDNAFTNIAMGIEHLIEHHFKLQIAPPENIEAPTVAVTQQPYLYSPGSFQDTPSPYASLSNTPIQGSTPPSKTPDNFPAHLYTLPLPRRSSTGIRSLILSSISALFLFGFIAGVIFLLSQDPSLASRVIAVVFIPILLIIIILISTIRRKKAEREAARRREQDEREAARLKQETHPALDEILPGSPSLDGISEREYYKSALLAYEKALRADPTDGRAYRGKGNALYALEHYDAACAAFEQAVRCDPSAAAYSGMGNTLSQIKRYDEALAAYQKAIELDGTFAPAYYEVAQVLERLKRNEEARQARKKAEQLGYEE